MAESSYRRGGDRISCEARIKSERERKKAWKGWRACPFPVFIASLSRGGMGVEGGTRGNRYVEREKSKAKLV